MQHAGLQYGQGATGSHQVQSFTHQPETVAQPNGGSTTSSLRQFRKKDNLEKQQSDQNANSVNDNSSHVARVAPHSHYPRPNDYYRYATQFPPDYIIAYKEPSPVKYSEIAEPPSMQHVEHINPNIPKHKEKEYLEMCNNIPQQTHLKQPYTEHVNRQQTYPIEQNVHPQYLHKEPQVHHNYKPESQYTISKELQYHQQYNSIPKCNMPPQNRNKYSPPAGPNDFLSQLQRINPTMARSIMNDHHMRESQHTYPAMDQNRMYSQSQRYYPAPIQGNPQAYSHNYTPHRSIPQPAYHYPPSCSYKHPVDYGRPSHQISNSVPRFSPPNHHIDRNMNAHMEHNTPHIERSMSPNRRTYPDNLSVPMNYTNVPQKISPNYGQYNHTPEYAQHYQHRRPTVAHQDYYQQSYHSSQYMPPHELPSETPESRSVTVSNSIKQYIETWAEEDGAAEIPPLESNKYPVFKENIRLRDDAHHEQLFVINSADLPHYLENSTIVCNMENGVVRIIDSSNANEHSTIAENANNVVNLHIVEGNNPDCLLSGQQTQTAQSSELPALQNEPLKTPTYVTQPVQENIQTNNLQHPRDETNRIIRNNIQSNKSLETYSPNNYNFVPNSENKEAVSSVNVTEGSCTPSTPPATKSEEKPCAEVTAIQHSTLHIEDVIKSMENNLKSPETITKADKTEERELSNETSVKENISHENEEIIPEPLLRNDALPEETVTTPENPDEKERRFSMPFIEDNISFDTNIRNTIKIDEDNCQTEESSCNQTDSELSYSSDEDCPNLNEFPTIKEKLENTPISESKQEKDSPEEDTQNETKNSLQEENAAEENITGIDLSKKDEQLVENLEEEEPQAINLTMNSNKLKENSKIIILNNTVLKKSDASKASRNIEKPNSNNPGDCAVLNTKEVSEITQNTNQSMNVEGGKDTNPLTNSSINNLVVKKTVLSATKRKQRIFSVDDIINKIGNKNTEERRSSLQVPSYQSNQTPLFETVDKIIESNRKVEELKEKSPLEIKEDSFDKLKCEKDSQHEEIEEVVSAESCNSTNYKSTKETDVLLTKISVITSNKKELIPASAADNKLENVHSAINNQKEIQTSVIKQNTSSENITISPEKRLEDSEDISKSAEISAIPFECQKNLETVPNNEASIPEKSAIEKTNEIIPQDESKSSHSNEAILESTDDTEDAKSSIVLPDFQGSSENTDTDNAIEKIKEKPSEEISTKELSDEVMDTDNEGEIAKNNNVSLESETNLETKQNSEEKPTNENKLEDTLQDISTTPEDEIQKVSRDSNVSEQKNLDTSLSKPAESFIINDEEEVVKDTVINSDVPESEDEIPKLIKNSEIIASSSSKDVIAVMTNNEDIKKTETEQEIIMEVGEEKSAPIEIATPIKENDNKIELFEDSESTNSNGVEEIKNLDNLKESLDCYEMESDKSSLKIDKNKNLIPKAEVKMSEENVILTEGESLPLVEKNISVERPEIFENLKEPEPQLPKEKVDENITAIENYEKPVLHEETVEDISKSTTELSDYSEENKTVVDSDKNSNEKSFNIEEVCSHTVKQNNESAEKNPAENKDNLLVENIVEEEPKLLLETSDSALDITDSAKENIEEVAESVAELASDTKPAENSEFQYRSAIRIEENNVLLEIAGELIEININSINGKKVISVLPFSDDTLINCLSDNLVDINDNYESEETYETPNVSVSEETEIEDNPEEIRCDALTSIPESNLNNDAENVFIDNINDQDNIIINEEVIESSNNNKQDDFEDIPLENIEENSGNTSNETSLVHIGEDEVENASEIIGKIEVKKCDEILLDTENTDETNKEVKNENPTPDETQSLKQIKKYETNTYVGLCTKAAKKLYVTDLNVNATKLNISKSKKANKVILENKKEKQVKSSSPKKENPKKISKSNVEISKEQKLKVNKSPMGKTKLKLVKTKETEGKPSKKSEDKSIKRSKRISEKQTDLEKINSKQALRRLMEVRKTKKEKKTDQESSVETNSIEKIATQNSEETGSESKSSKLSQEEDDRTLPEKTCNKSVKSAKHVSKKSASSSELIEHKAERQKSTPAKIKHVKRVSFSTDFPQVFCGDSTDNAKSTGIESTTEEKSETNRFSSILKSDNLRVYRNKHTTIGTTAFDKNKRKLSLQEYMKKRQLSQEMEQNISDETAVSSSTDVCSKNVTQKRDKEEIGNKTENIETLLKSDSLDNLLDLSGVKQKVNHKRKYTEISAWELSPKSAYEIESTTNQEDCLILINNNKKPKCIIDINELDAKEYSPASSSQSNQNNIDDILQTYKEKVDLKLSSLNLKIPIIKSQKVNSTVQKSINSAALSQRELSESNMLMRRFLNRDKLSPEDIYKVRRIILYKRLIEMSQKPNESSSKHLQNFDIKPGKTVSKNENEVKIHLKKLEHVQRKRKRFRNLYAADSSDETESSDYSDKYKNLGDYSVYQKDCAGVPKLIIKRTQLQNDLQPIVRLERSYHLDLLAKKRKYY